MYTGSINYAIGILTSQPARVYATGAGITTTFKMLLASAGLFQGITTSSGEITSSALMLFIKTLLPVFASPESAIPTILLNVGIGAAIWTRNWSVGMA